jgi:hypothetical protein
MEAWCQERAHEAEVSLQWFMVLPPLLPWGMIMLALSVQ